MRVLYILHSSIMGGATISFLNLLFGIKKKGVEPYVIVNKNNDSEELIAILNRNGITFSSVDIVKSVIIPRSTFRGKLSFVKQYLLLPLKKIKSRKEIERVCRRIDPDIIHTNTGVVHEGFRVARKLNIPHVWHLREYQTKDFNWIIYPSKNKFCSDLLQSYVITISNGIRSYFKLNDSPRAFTIYNGIFSKEMVLPILKKENYFLLCSRVTAEKGHDEAIKAFSRFSKRDSYQLVIAGFGNQSYIDYLTDLSKSLDCFDRVRFVGFKNDVVDLISKAKALLVPSYYEGFGRMTAEAAFCGTIVIGRNTGGTEEIINKTGGYLFSTTEELVEKMELVAGLTVEDYNGIAGPSQQIAKECYSIEGNVDRTFALYSQILVDQKAKMQL